MDGRDDPLWRSESRATLMIARAYRHDPTWPPTRSGSSARRSRPTAPWRHRGAGTGRARRSSSPTRTRPRPAGARRRPGAGVRVHIRRGGRRRLTRLVGGAPRRPVPGRSRVPLAAPVDAAWRGSVTAVDRSPVRHRPPRSSRRRRAGSDAPRRGHGTAPRSRGVRRTTRPISTGSAQRSSTASAPTASSRPHRRARSSTTRPPPHW
jgi:hypothetical protein